jgi:hypothetical protein
MYFRSISVALTSLVRYGSTDGIALVWQRSYNVDGGIAALELAGGEESLRYQRSVLRMGEAREGGRE